MNPLRRHKVISFGYQVKQNLKSRAWTHFQKGEWWVWESGPKINPAAGVKGWTSTPRKRNQRDFRFETWGSTFRPNFWTNVVFCTSFNHVGSETRSSHFEPKISWISFSRGSGPPLTPVAGSVFGQLSQTHFSKSEFKNGQISKSCFVFQVIQVTSSAKFVSAEEVDLTLSTALNLVHRYYFPKLSDFS